MAETICITTVIILSGALVALLGLFLVSRFYAWFSRNKIKLLAALALSGIVLYAVDYAVCLTESVQWQDYISISFLSVYNTFRTFFLEMDASALSSELSWLSFVFGIISFGVLLTMSTIIFSFVGYRSLCLISMWFFTFFPQKTPTYIFTSLNEKALLLAEDIAKKQRPSRIVFLKEDKPVTSISSIYEDKMGNDKEVIKQILERGYYLLDMPRELSADGHSGKKHTKLSLSLRIISKLSDVTIFANSKNEHENAVFINDFANIQNESKNAATLCPFVINNYYDKLWEDPALQPYPLRVINENDLAVRQLFDYDGLNLAKCIKPDNTLTVLVSGYSGICPSLYSTLAYMGQFDGVDFKMIWVNGSIEDDTACYFVENTEIYKCVTIELLPLKPGSPAYYDYLRENMANIGCIIHADEDLCIASELLRMRFLTAGDTALCLYAPQQKQYRLLFDKQQEQNLFLFGGMREVYTKNIVLDEGLDKIAIQFNEAYNKTTKNGGNSWEKLRLFDKQSNRSLALQAVSKLYRIGIACEYDGKGGNAAIFEQKISHPDILNCLARGEHMRWNAFSFANGWRTKTEYDPADGKTRKDSARRLHALLVDWDELGRLCKAFDTDFKEYDYKMLQAMGQILVDAGYTLKSIEDNNVL
jgi:hypothetical protein